MPSLAHSFAETNTQHQNWGKVAVTVSTLCNLLNNQNELKPCLAFCVPTSSSAKKIYLHEQEQNHFEFTVRKNNLFLKGSEEIRISSIVLKNGVVINVRGGEVSFRKNPPPLLLHSSQKPCTMTAEFTHHATSECPPKPATSQQKQKPEEELELFRRIVEDLDQTALEIYFKQKNSSLRRFARKFYPDEIFSHDIVQNAFVKILHQMARKADNHKNGWCQNVENFDTWVHGVVRNEACNLAVLQKRHNHQTFDTVNDAPEKNESGLGQNYIPPDESANLPCVAKLFGYSDPLKHLVDLERRGNVNRRLNGITTLASYEQNVRILLDHIGDGDTEGASHKELSARNNVSPNAIKKRIQRARELLRELYPDLAFSPC